MAFVDGFDIGSNLTTDWGSNRISNAVKSYSSGEAFDQKPLVFGGPYSTSGPAKTFYLGFDMARTSPVFGTIYVSAPNRYVVRGYIGTIEASTRSRLLRPGDNGIDISYFNLDQQRITFIISY
jgi:hypothetical protein